jgi:hypothetical protein
LLYLFIFFGDWIINELGHVPCIWREDACLTLTFIDRKLKKGRQVYTFLETECFVFWNQWLLQFIFGRVKLNPLVPLDNYFRIWASVLSDTCFLLSVVMWLAYADGIVILPSQNQTIGDDLLYEIGTFFNYNPFGDEATFLQDTCLQTVRVFTSSEMDIIWSRSSMYLN